MKNQETQTNLQGHYGFPALKSFHFLDIKYAGQDKQLPSSLEISAAQYEQWCAMAEDLGYHQIDDMLFECQFGDEYILEVTGGVALDYGMLLLETE